jgi:Zn finger protein HypA/HybF involved in hydrogenase expression
MKPKVYAFSNISAINFQLVNEFRIKMGLKPLVIKKKNCLRCSDEFETEAHNQFMCNVCGSGNYADVDGMVQAYSLHS